MLKNAVNKALNHKASQKAFDKTMEQAIGAVFTFATGGATDAFSRVAVAFNRKRDKRKERRDANDLARQVGGTVSLNVIIGSERYHVVWLADKTFYRVIPESSKVAGPLEEHPDIKLFSGERKTPKPRKS